MQMLNSLTSSFTRIHPEVESCNPVTNSVFLNNLPLSDVGCRRRRRVVVILIPAVDHAACPQY